MSVAVARLIRVITVADARRLLDTRARASIGSRSVSDFIRASYCTRAAANSACKSMAARQVARRSLAHYHVRVASHRIATIRLQHLESISRARVPKGHSTTSCFAAAALYGPPTRNRANTHAHAHTIASAATLLSAHRLCVQFFVASSSAKIEPTMIVLATFLIQLYEPFRPIASIWLCKTRAAL